MFGRDAVFSVLDVGIKVIARVPDKA